MRAFLIVTGKLFLLATVFLVPLLLFVWYHRRTESESLRSIASFVTVILSFFLCSFVGLCLDPKYRDLSLGERLLASLLFATALGLIMIVSIPLRKIASSIFKRFLP